MCSARTPRASVVSPGSVTSTCASVEPRDPAEPSHSPLGVVGDDDDTFGRGKVRLVRLALEQVRRREAGVDADAVHAEEQHVDVKGAKGRDRDGPDQRVGRRAHPAREDHREVGPAHAVEHVRDLDRVRDDRQVRNVEQVVGEAPGRRAGGEADRLAGLDESARGSGDRLLLVELAMRLRLESRLVRAQPTRSRGTAVNLVDEAGRREHVEVAPDGHVGDVEQLGQLANTDRAAASNFIDDQFLTLFGEHDRSGQYSTRSNKSQQRCTTRIVRDRLDMIPLDVPV